MNGDTLFSLELLVWWRQHDLVQTFATELKEGKTRLKHRLHLSRDEPNNGCEGDQTVTGSWKWFTLAAANLRGEATATSSTKLDGMSPFLFLSCWGEKRFLQQQTKRQQTTTEHEVFSTNLCWNNHDACHVLTLTHNKRELPERHRSMTPG